MLKLFEGLFGKPSPIRYERSRAAELGGGAQEMVLQRFEDPSLPVDLINGSGVHVNGFLKVIEPGLVATHPAGAALDIAKLTYDQMDPFVSGGFDSFQANELPE